MISNKKNKKSNSLVINNKFNRNGSFSNNTRNKKNNH